MTKFRCPICKYEIKSTKYIKIKSARCTSCKIDLIKLYNPTKKILKLEKELNMEKQKDAITKAL